MRACCGQVKHWTKPGLQRERVIAILMASVRLRHARPLPAENVRRPPMTQTKGRFFDEMGRLMNDAAGVAQGVRREFDTLFRTQAERILRDLEVVSREEFEAVKEMAQLAREENEKLKARIQALELAAAARSDQPSEPGWTAPPPA